MRNLKLFETEAAYAAEEENLVRPNVSHVRESGHNYFHPVGQRDYSREYLTCEVLEDGLLCKIAITQSFPFDMATGYSISYSLNGGEWLDLPSINIMSPDLSTCIPVSDGDIIRFKGINATLNSGNTMCHPIVLYDSTLENPIEFNVYGNIMSIIYGDNFIGQTLFPNGSDANIAGIFQNSNIVDASNLILPATTLTDDCYAGMFENCSSLVNAPELPATTLVDSCYNNMFYGCSNLSYIKAMFTTTPSNTYTQNWVSGVASTGTFVMNSEAIWNVVGTNGIPNGWTIIDENGAPIDVPQPVL